MPVANLFGFGWVGAIPQAILLHLEVVAHLRVEAEVATEVGPLDRSHRLTLAISLTSLALVRSELVETLPSFLDHPMAIFDLDHEWLRGGLPPDESLLSSLLQAEDRVVIILDPETDDFADG